MNYDERQKFEHELIDRKLRWLLMSQTILFAALALVFSNGKTNDADKPFLTIFLSCLGLVTSALMTIGVLFAVLGKRRNYKDELRKQESNRPLEYKQNPIQWGVRTKLTDVATFSDYAMPIVFFLAWGVILIRQLSFADHS
jgi:hypothetical protein